MSVSKGVKWGLGIALGLLLAVILACDACEQRCEEFGYMFEQCEDELRGDTHPWEVHCSGRLCETPQDAVRACREEWHDVQDYYREVDEDEKIQNYRDSCKASAGEIIEAADEGDCWKLSTGLFG